MMDSELMFWIVTAVVGVIAFGVMCCIAKKEDEKYMDMGDWE